MSKKKVANMTLRATVKAENPIKKSIHAMSIPELITTINSAAAELKRRNLPVRDWDNKDREFYKVTILGGKAYILLPHKEQ